MFVYEMILFNSSYSSPLVPNVCCKAQSRGITSKLIHVARKAHTRESMYVWMVYIGSYNNEKLFIMRSLEKSE